MELLQLRYFLDTAELGSMAKTAEKYMVPSSSVSACIRRLEKELGCSLFSRSSNSITLNENGRKLKNSLKLVFAELDSAVDGIMNPDGDEREIKILVKALRSVVTDKIIRYENEHIGARFRLFSSFDDTDYEHYDIVVDTKSDFYEGYECIEICKQKISIFAASDSPLLGKKLTLSSLKEHSFVNMSQYGRQYKLLSEACRQSGFEPKLAAQINDYVCFIKFIESGTCIGAAGEESIKVSDNMKIVPLDVTDFKEYQTVCVYYKKEVCYGNVKRFIDFLNTNSI